MNRETYHHGALRDALIQAADDIISDKGIEGFSLRKAASLAGVSPGAPAHHFGSIAGLLTEVTIRTLNDLAGHMNRISTDGDPAVALRSFAETYIRFALANRGRMRLTFRKDLILRDDPRVLAASMAAFYGFFQASGAYHGIALPDEGRAQDLAPALLIDFATLQGIATLAIEDNLSFALDVSNPQPDFFNRLLPAMLGEHWPSRAGA